VQVSPDHDAGHRLACGEEGTRQFEPAGHGEGERDPNEDGREEVARRYADAVGS
jgi:hypothetical protein